MAWMILISAFTCFCALVIGLAFAIPWLLENASVGGGACVVSINGTVRLGTSARQAPDAVTGPNPRCDAVAGAGIGTDGSYALVTTYADPANRSDRTQMGRVQLFNDTQMVLQQVKVPFFGFSKQPNQVQIRFERGNMRVTTQAANNRNPLWRISLGSDAERGVELGAGEYSLHLQDNSAQVSVLAGEPARVTVGRQTAIIAKGQDAELLGSQLVTSTGRDLIVKGDFQEPLEPDWEVVQFPAAPQPLGTAPQVLPTAGLEGNGKGRVLRLARHGEDKIHTEVRVVQKLDQDLTSVQSLMLRMDLQINYQSLSGGGNKGSEYPVAVWIDYTDIYGNAQFWVRGFYAKDPEDPLWPLTNGERTPLGALYSFDSGNLLQQSPFKDAKPARLNGIRIYASGWNYDATVDNIKLIMR